MLDYQQFHQYRTAVRDRFRPDTVPAAAVGMTAGTLLLWTVLLRGWLPLPSMPGPMTAPGVPEAMGTTNGVVGVAAYLLMWGVMMSAMMYPAMLPLVRRYTDRLDGDAVTVGSRIVALLAGYSLVWTVTGVVPLLADALVGIRELAVTHGPLLLFAGGLLVAGYQQTERKRAALRDCCSTADVAEPSLTVRAAARRGLRHGRECVLATWPLFALMVVAGSMNPVVMLGLTLVIAAERLPPWGEEVATAVGLTAGVAGFVALLVPTVVA